VDRAARQRDDDERTGHTTAMAVPGASCAAAGILADPLAEPTDALATGIASSNIGSR
jgi:hypothetical protein